MPEQQTSDVGELIAGLNQDLSAEYQAVVMYRTYAALVSGPWRQELRAFFEKEIPDELGHAALLADRVVALGGTPSVTVGPVPIPRDAREMLENALQAEVDTIERYIRRIAQADACGELSIRVQLENLVVDESTHRDEIRRMLMDWR
jgi:bacterioferritin